METAGRSATGSDQRMSGQELEPAQTEPLPPESLDDILGPAPSGDGLDAILGPPPKRSFMSRIIPSGADVDHMLSQTTSAVGRVLSAFGQGAENGWGAGNLGLSDETADALKKVGVFSDVAKGQGGVIRAFNEGLIRDAAAGFDAVMRAGSAVIGGAQGAVAQTGEEVGLPGLGRDIAALPEAFPQETGGAPGVLRLPRPIDLPAARSLGVIGEPEAVYNGTAEPAPPPESAASENVHRAQEAAKETPPIAPAEPDMPTVTVTAEPAPEAPTDVHGLARQIAPQTFDEYDALTAHRDRLRQQIDAEQQALQANAEAQAPGAAEIADLQQRLEDTTPRLAKKYQARLDALLPARDAFLADEFTMGALTRETPEIGALRQQLLETEYRMRDLAPDVTEAYRKAAEQMPVVAEPAGPEAATPEPAPAAPAAVEASSAEPEAAPAEPVAPTPPPVPVRIADDVSRKLQAAGRPAEEADAAGQVTEALWQTRAAAFEGRKGSAEDMYAREAPEIRSGRARAPEFAQKGRVLEQPAYHGSPHIFDKFTLDHIGTGEGAQAYGHGLYFAGNKAVAKYYREALSGFKEDAYSALSNALDTAQTAGGRSIEDTLNAWKDDPNVFPELREAAADPEVVRLASNVANEDKGSSAELRAYGKLDKYLKKKFSNKGRLYHVDIPDDDEYLDWDKPIGEQSLKVKAALEKAGITDADDKFGEEVYRDLTRRFQGFTPPKNAPAEASRLLNEAGIPGIRYLDQGSRNAEAGSHNYVVFDDSRIHIRDFEQRAQGKIRLTDDGRSVITLMRTANASTFLHEMGHDWLERMMRDATDPDAPQRMRADAATVRKYLGVNEADAIPTRAHEKFARSFERYFMEGRAPTQALAGVFAKFKQWLTTIYQTVAKLRAPITDDIRDVFDRLLATNPDRAAAVPETAVETELPPAEPKKPTPLIAKQPKEPERLASFLRRMGGIADKGGDVKQMLGGAKYRPGLINSKGMGLDEAALRAWENGYFPEFGAERPAINDLLDALEADLRGEPRYSAHDEEAVGAYQEAVNHNAEVQRLAANHDIDTTSMTREQFFSALSEKLSFEKFAEEMRSLETAHEADFGEFAAEAREWAEERYGHWDSNEIYGIDGPRTEKELEALYGSENAAGPAGQGASGGGEPIPAAGPAQPGEASGGQGGRGLGDGGRAGEKTGATKSSPEPAGPNQPIERSESELVDKAGNIRLDNLNQPEDVDAVIREAAEANDEFIGARRGVISDAQVIDLADALGMKASDLNQRKLGQAFNAEQVMAARKLLIQSATAVRDAMVKAATGSDQDVMAYGEAAARHRMIQEQVAGITAEAGRALRAFRAIGEEGDQVKAIGDFVQAATGKTLFQMRREARAGALLETPAQVSKFIQDSQKPSFGDMLLEYWVNGLISNPATHGTYLVGNALLAAAKAVPETAVQAALGSVRELMGSTEPRVYWGEVGAQLHAIFAGQRNGIKAAWKAAQTGLTTELPGETEGQAQGSFLGTQARTGGAIPGRLGDVVRLPARGVATLHSYSRAIGYSQEIARQAYRQAASEGLEGNAFAARIADLTQNPTPQMMETARNEATQQTLMGQGGELVQKLADFTAARVNLPVLGSTQVLKFIDPFVKIGANVMNQALLQRSPLGVFDPEIRANLMGVNGSVARDMQISRIAVGSAIGAAVMGLVAQDMVTGGGPSDPKEADLWRLSGKQPYSLRVGDTWYQYHRLGPLAMIMGVAADLYEVGDAAASADVSKVGQLLVGSLAKNLLDESFMRGPSDLMRAVDDSDRYGARYVRDQLGSWIPFSSALAMLARSSDPYSRQARTIVDALKERTPGLSRTLLPRRDIWGQPIQNKDVFGPPGLSAIRENPVDRDPVNEALIRLNIWPGQPRREIKSVKLTDQQYDDYSRTAGMMAKMRLDAIVGTPGFSAAPSVVQEKTIRETIEHSRQGAEALIMMQNPDIIRQSKANKAAQLAR